ncbi:DUF6036 family nucleotidyltransferase [Cohnella kolymensis]|uniref:DUF6036 family nucleotidyltransferase n=1 Tax=Cohnella kolymensis TaxID=1590652 RepID=UPI00069674AF|nr:DUF6036 family nucleotidyltransferase [Cohnella kolymensis]
MSNANDNGKMDKEKMISALSMLNEKLGNSDETGEIILFGGAVMCLVFGSRGYTRDIEAVFEPKGSIYAYAREIAEEAGLPLNWLNDGVKVWLYTEPETELVMQLNNLRVLAAKPEYILAMKCYAARLDTDDLNDARVLANHLGLKDRNQVLDIVEKYIPSKLLSVKTAAFAEALFV